MPAREALAPAAVPAELAIRVRCLPQREVRVVALVRFQLAAMPAAELVERVPRQRAVARERGDLVVQVTGGGEVGVTQILKLLRELEHHGDVFSSAWGIVGMEGV